MNVAKENDLRCSKNSAHKAVKGFTLIEMIVVIAIIAVLAGMLSLVIPGFVRDSKQETNNNNAQLVYTAVQNALIQSEIKQDSSYLDSQFLKGSSAQLVKTVEMKLNIQNGSFATNGITIAANGTYNGANAISFDGSTANINQQKSYKFLEKYVLDNLSADFTGICLVSIDYTNYMVQSVIYIEEVDETDFTSVIGGLSKYQFLSEQGMEENLFYGVTDYSAQRDIYRGANGGIYFGCYPLLKDLELACKDANGKIVNALPKGSTTGTGSGEGTGTGTGSGEGEKE